jgi:hypothetical protein
MTEEGHSMNDENIDTHFFTPLAYLEYADITYVSLQLALPNAKSISLTS